jgi:xanthine dioxygenase
MAIELTALPLPPSADPSKFADFGRQVTGVHPGNFTPDEFNAIREALYKVRRRHHASSSPSCEHELTRFVCSTTFSCFGMSL